MRKKIFQSMIVLFTLVSVFCSYPTSAYAASAKTSQIQVNPLSRAHLSVDVINDGRVYANNLDVKQVEIVATDGSGDPLINQPLLIRTPVGVSVQGNQNTQNGLAVLSFSSNRAVSSTVTVRLANNIRVQKSFRINFSRINRFITNRTDARTFNVDCPITFIAETSRGANFVRGEVVYDYRRLISRIWGKSGENRRVVVPMTLENDQWIGTIGTNDTAKSRVSRLRFSYYFRLYDKDGRVYQSRRYNGYLSMQSNW